MSESPLPSHPLKSPSIVSPSIGEDFLKAEYTLLNEWAIHGEDVAHRIFNFYITLLTAILGGLLVIIQFLSSNVQTSLILVGGTCSFLLLLGIIFYDALVSQYIQNAYYHAGILSIRAHFRRYQEPASSLLDPPSFLARTGGERTFDSVVHSLTSVKIGLPAGNQLSLIAGINSLLVGAIVWSLVWGAAGIGYRITTTVLVAAACALISAVVHSKLADLMIKRNLAQVNRVDNEVQT